MSKDIDRLLRVKLWINEGLRNSAPKIVKRIQDKAATKLNPSSSFPIQNQLMTRGGALKRALTKNNIKVEGAGGTYEASKVIDSKYSYFLSDDVIPYSPRQKKFFWVQYFKWRSRERGERDTRQGRLQEVQGQWKSSVWKALARKDSFKGRGFVKSSIPEVNWGKVVASELRKLFKGSNG